jgi:Family of unknown function (DUF6644)
MFLPFFQWCESTTLSRVVRESVWMFPVTEAIHLVGLCLLGGSLLIVDLRLLGVGLKLKGSSVAELDHQVRPWLLGSITLMLGTGFLLFFSEAVKCYYSHAFWVKITTIPLAILFTLAVRERFARKAAYASAFSQWVGAADLLLWFIVAAGGRWIGFS